MSTPEANKALSKAKVHLLNTEGATFFSSLCCQLEHVWVERVPTAATNGTQIFYNPTWFLNQEPAHRVGVMLHEILHVALQHTIAGATEGLQPGKCNRAMDYAINLIIVDAGFKLPGDALLDRQYAGMGWREIYALLDDEPEDDKFNDIEPSDDPGLVDTIDDMLVQATQQAQSAGDRPGSIPGEIERYVHDLLNPKLPWHRILANFYTQTAKVETSMQRPNRRFFSRGILLPGLAGNKLCNGMVGVDVSGSITSDQFDPFIAEAGAVIKNLRPDLLHFLQFDTKITSDDEIRIFNDLRRVKFTGGGGTNIQPIMEWCRTNKPDWALIFTDGYYDPPEFNPKVPVIWVVYDNPNFKAPFGKVIHYQLPELKKAA